MNAEYKLTLTNKSANDAEPKVAQLLNNAKKNLGFIPNMYAAMANSSILFDSYISGYEVFREKSSFTAAEQEVIFLAISRENDCHYCVAAHSFIADNMSKVPIDVTNAIRQNSEIADVKLAALALFSQTMVAKRGLATKEDVKGFLEVGYSEQQILEIILAISIKTISNYANHLFHTDLDQIFSAREWQS